MVLYSGITSVTVNNNSPIQDYVHSDDQTQPPFEMALGFKPFTVLYNFIFKRQVFQGNTDRHTIVLHALSPAVKARFVRFYYVSYHNWPAIRVEIYKYA